MRKKPFHLLLMVLLAWSAALSADEAGLVGYWKFDDGLADSMALTAQDSSGNENHGTLEGLAGWANEDAIMGGAADIFNEGNSGGSIIRIPHNETQNMPNMVTGMGWCKMFGQNNWESLMTKGVEATPWTFMLSNNRYLTLEVNNDGGNGAEIFQNAGEVTRVQHLNSSLALPDPGDDGSGAEWVFWCYRHDGKEVTWFLNDRKEVQRLENVVYGILEEDLIFGADLPSGDKYFDGLIDEFRLYNGAVSDEMIAQIYAAGRAYFPVPDNGAESAGKGTLSWSVESTTVTFNVSIGTDPNNLETLATDLPNDQRSVEADVLEKTKYYWKVDVVENGTVNEGLLWSFTTTGQAATVPVPVSGAENVADEGLVVSWDPGFNAVSHDVYFGPDVDELAKVDSVAGNTYEPNVAAGARYAWRIDAVQADGSVIPGEVWTFRTIADYVVDDNLIAWYQFDEGAGKASRDWSGNGNDAELIGDTTWVADGYFDRAVQLNGDGWVQMHMMDDLVDVTSFTYVGWYYEPVLKGSTTLFSIGSGNKDLISIQAHDGGGNNMRVNFRSNKGGHNRNNKTITNHPFPTEEWTHIALSYDAGAELATVYENGTSITTLSSTVTFKMMEEVGSGLSKAFIGRGMNWNESVLFEGQVDDVRMYGVALTEEQVAQVMAGDPRRPFDPRPRINALTGRGEEVVFSWKAGDGATAHSVYLGTTKDGMARISEAQTELTHNAGILEPGVYYWQVGEIQADGGEVPGQIWTFEVASFIILDNFEDYTDEDGFEIFQVWLDGFDDLSNGGLSAYDVPPYAEQNITRNGSFQSLPFRYNNAFSVYSEVYQVLADDDADWSGNGTLRFWYRGQEDNFTLEGDTFRVMVTDKANGSATVDVATPEGLLVAEWTQVDIDLGTLGVDLTQMATLSFIVGDKVNPTSGGGGTVFIEDIRLVAD